MSTEYLTIKNDSNLQQYTNSAYEKDEDDKEFKLQIERGKHKTQTDDVNNNNNNNFLGNDLNPNNKSPSFHQSLPVLNQTEPSKSEMFKSLFQLKNATAMVRSTVKRREHKAHLLIWLIIVIYLLLLVFSNGPVYIMILFAQKVYAMTPSE